MRTEPQVRCGALGGIRTPNLLIRSQMLYPLSYERTATRPAESSVGGGPSRNRTVRARALGVVTALTLAVVGDYR